MQDREQTLYESYISCVGNICGFFCCTCQKIETSSVAMIERFGQYTKTLEPGLFYYNPLTETIK